MVGLPIYARITPASDDGRLGFDFGVTGNTTALPAFQKQFGIPYPDSPSGFLIPANYLAGWSGAATGGDILGILIAGQLIEWIGRKALSLRWICHHRHWGCHANCKPRVDSVSLRSTGQWYVEPSMTINLY